MKKNLIIFICFCIIFLNIISATLNVSLSDQGTDVKNKSTGNILTSGNLKVVIYDNLTGGSLVYSETFSGAIVNGSWNVMLGENSSNPLQLEFGKIYYKDYEINGVDLDFIGFQGNTLERQFFYSPLGDIGGEDINQSTNLTISGLNLSGGNITNVNYGLFSFLGSLADRITKLFVIDVNVSNNIGVGGNLTVDTNTLFVDSDDNRVGIGTTAPSQKLDVVGAIQLSDNSGSNEAGTMRWTGTEFQAYNGTDWNTFGTTGGGASLWSQTGNDIYYNNGNVGIGTGNPSTILDIQGTTADTTRIWNTRFSNDAYASELGLRKARGTIGTPLAVAVDDRVGALVYYGYNGTEFGYVGMLSGVVEDITDGAIKGGLAFNTASGVGTTTERMRIDNTGNVGIGTGSPTSKLDLIETLAVFPSARISNDNSTDDIETGIRFRDKSTTGQNFHVDLFLNGTGSETGRFGIRVPYQTERFTILSNGSVGIGTTSPAEELSVEGSGNVGININSKDGGHAFISLDNGSASTEFWDIGKRNDAQKNRFYIYDHTGGGGSNSEVFTILKGGNVGIGTTSPLTGIAQTNVKTTNVSLHYGQLALLDDRAVADEVGGLLVFGGKYTGSTYTTWAGISGIKETATDGQFGGELAFYTRLHGGALGERMRILSDGKVGIGTTSPGVKLEVANSARSFSLSSSSTLDVIGTSISSRTTSTVQDILRLHQPNTESVSKGSTFAIGLSFYEDPGNNYPRTRVDFKTTGKTTDDSDAGNTVMSLRDDGNVGIGTTSPLADLHISGSEELRLGGTAAEGYVTFETYKSGSGAGRARFNAVDGTGTGDASYTFDIGGNTKLRILNNGNVGIGTTSPDDILHVSKDGATSATVPMIRIENTHTTIDAGETFGGILWESQDTSTNGVGISGFINNTAINAGVSSALAFGTRPATGSANAIERVRIDPDGNVGIGTASPGEKLEVAGDVYITGSGGTIGRSNLANAWLKVGTTLGMDPNELYFDTPAYIGTLGNNALSIDTNGTSSVYILGNGNVGIGTTTPSEKLDVNGKILFRFGADYASWEVVSDGAILNLDSGGRWKFTEDGKVFWWAGTYWVQKI